MSMWRSPHRKVRRLRLTADLKLPIGKKGTATAGHSGNGPKPPRKRKAHINAQQPPGMPRGIKETKKR